MTSRVTHPSRQVSHFATLGVVPARYWRSTPRQRCPECLELVVRDSRAIYCGQACRAAAYRRRKQQARSTGSRRYVNSPLCLSQNCDNPITPPAYPEAPQRDVSTPRFGSPAEETRAGLSLVEVPAVASEVVDVDRFYSDLLEELGNLARAGGSAIGAAAVAKRVALAHGVRKAEFIPLPRLTRAQQDELGLRGAGRRRVRRA